MPRVRVPLQPPLSCGHMENGCSCNNDSSRDEIAIAYKVKGNGPVLVALVPGALVPCSMYDALAAELAADGRYTSVAIDNRGIGQSDSPPFASSLGAAARGRLNYSPSILANDAWSVLDHVRSIRCASDVHSETSSPCGFEREVALVGHSMGGMVVQRMLMQRPTQVRFAALLSTHAGGFWNFLPTTTLFLSALRLIVNRFDTEVTALVHLDLHFTGSFLDQLVEPASYVMPRLASTFSSSIPSALSSLQSLARSASLPRFSSSSKTFATVNGTKNSEHQPSVRQRLVLRRKRRDVYFARYIGRDFDWISGLPGDPRHPEISEYADEGVIDDDKSYTEVDKTTTDASRSTLHSNPRLARSTANLPETRRREPTQVGHILVALQHRLWPSEAMQISNCKRLQTLVVAGSHDRVTTPLASRTLARHIESLAYVELQGAHFIFDERARQVNRFLHFGLNASYFRDSESNDYGLQLDANKSLIEQCACQWCCSKKHLTEGICHGNITQYRWCFEHAKNRFLTCIRSLSRMAGSVLPTSVRHYLEP